MTQFLTSQGYGLQYTIGKINVHLILTKYIWVLKGAPFSPAHWWKHPQPPTIFFKWLDVLTKKFIKSLTVHRFSEWFYRTEQISGIMGKEISI